MTSASPTLLPWILVDPALSDWEDPCPAECNTRNVTEFLRRHCSVVIGELDYESIVERANDGRDSSFRYLREALLRCPLHRQGLSLDEPDEVLAPDKSGIRVCAALVDSSRLEAIEMLGRQKAKVLNGALELINSSFRREVEDARVRKFHPGAEPIRIWNEVLEPFTRSPVLNVYESYIFNPFTWDEPHIPPTGLVWFLRKLAARAARDAEPLDVVVRGGFHWVAPQRYREVRDRMRQRCAELVAAMLPDVRLYLEPLYPRIHDRYLLARRPDQSSRVLESGYPVISNLGKFVGIPKQPSHASKRDPEEPKPEVYSFTCDDQQANNRVREREWAAANSHVLFTERP